MKFLEIAIRNCLNIKIQISCVTEWYDFQKNNEIRQECFCLLFFE